MTKNITAEVAAPQHFSNVFKLFVKLHSHGDYDIYLKIFHILNQVRSIQGCEIIELK